MRIQNLEVRKKLGKKLFAGLFTLTLMLSCTIPSLAKDYWYGSYCLTCTNTINKYNVKASTDGAPTPYYNNVALVVYNEDGECKGSKTAYKKAAKITVKINKSNMKSSISCHSMLDTDYSHVLPFNKQIVINK